MNAKTELTQEQSKVVETDGNLLVIAGPGTGKTYTLISKLKHLVEKGKEPVVLTYSVKTSKELTEKVRSAGLDAVKVDTFHGFAYDIVWNCFEKPPKLIEEEEKKQILKKLFPKEKNPLSNPKNKEVYFKFLEKNEVFDFELLLKKAAQLAPKLENVFTFVVDEFQDISPDIIELLKSFKNSTFIFFGDPNQSIYSFKGVSLEALKNFVEKLPDLKVLHLSYSFRCPSKILAFAEGFKVSPWESPKFKAVKEGGKVEALYFEDPYLEAEYLAKRVKKLLGGLQMEEQRFSTVSPGDIFVLSRIKQVFHHIKNAFEKNGIPTSLAEERAESMLKKIKSFAQKLLSSVATVEDLIKSADPEVEVTLKNLWELSEGSKEKFYSYLEFCTAQDILTAEREGVNFMSIHASKGLEAKYVFLVGAEKGLIPLKIFKDTLIDEEKRLVYVAITRTVENFVLTAVKERKVFNFRLNYGISPFFSKKIFKTVKRPPKKPKQGGLF